MASCVERRGGVPFREVVLLPVSTPIRGGILAVVPPHDVILVIAPHTIILVIAPHTIILVIAPHTIIFSPTLHATQNVSNWSWTTYTTVA